MTDARFAHPLDGAALLEVLAIAATHLADQRAAIDAINVYPVPDGDTGSNMSATFSAAVEAGRSAADDGAGAVLAAVAKGALYGARGNSGVILSQALRGLAEAAKGATTLDSTLLANALERAATMAYAAVSNPVEGTMLTVLRAAARGARAHLERLSGSGDGTGSKDTLAAASRAADDAEALTPTQLPALAEAGVTDSGGEGVCVILRGILAALTGEALPVSAVAPAQPLAQLAGHATEDFGFCTEFLLEADGPTLAIEDIRAFAGRGENRSVVVVGDETAVRVHVHTDAPEPFLAEAAAFGRVTRAKVEDMTRQHGTYRATGSGAGAKIGVLAMSPGPGFDAIFASLGVHVAPLDQLKPAAGDIAAAAARLGTPDVIVLPNHANVLLAARQASSLARCTVTVVASQSLPQGIAAALAFDATRSLRANVGEMEEAMRAVTTIEVTVAAADRTADGVVVKAGDAIALINGRLVGRGANPLEVLVGALNRLADDGEGLITVYGGAEIDHVTLEATRTKVAARFPAATVDAHAGGQAVYSYIASIER